MTIADDIWDDLFHFCAFRAYIERAVVEQWPPDPKATRLLAYRLYEEALARKNAA